MQKKIKYIAFYDDIKEVNENRQFALSAINKIDYIIDSLIKNDYKVEIVSPSWTNNKSGFYKGRSKNIKKNVSLTLFSTYGVKSRLLRISKYIFSLLQLCIYLFLNTKKNEPIIVYHSVILIKPLLIIKKLKKIKLILEVEEIYSDVTKNKNQKLNEYKIFKEADGFIFPTELLNDKLNDKSKPIAITYGSYKVELDRKIKFNDDKTHIVYAGTFDQRKGGAQTAVDISKYLNEKYHIHIIGFGSEEEVKLLKNKIEKISNKTKCTITFDGLFRDEEYIRFLQKCHIGLSTQKPDDAYNDTSFPSKVLSYMSNGLRVVSIRINVLERSKINKFLYYYDKDNAKEIADIIMNIDLLQDYDSRVKIKELDNEFIEEINKLMENFNE